jgi:hypothetical protein
MMYRYEGKSSFPVLLFILIFGVGLAVPHSMFTAAGNPNPVLIATFHL